MNSFVFGTYAITEIIKGNSNYKLYEHSDIIINNFIYAELCYNCFRKGEGKINEVLDKYSKHIMSVKPEWIVEAMKFRLKWKDRNFSVTDCVSYIMAKNLGIKFLTGDKEFKDIENVEFVK